MSKIDDLDQIIIEALLASGIEPSDEQIDKLRSFVEAESGSEPFHYTLDDELFEQHSPETDREDIVVQLIATIEYMHYTYGEIIGGVEPRDRNHA